MRRSALFTGLALALLLGGLLLSNIPAHPAARAADQPAGPSLRPAGAEPSGIGSSGISPSYVPAHLPSSHPSARTSAVRPADTCSGSPNWVSGSTNFFTDVNVCFSLLGSSQPFYLPTVPLQGNVSQYAIGFFVNISSNVQIFSANICIWATSWPAPGVGAQAISGYDPSGWNGGDCRPMVPGTSSGLNKDTASYYIDCYKYFWPGTNLSFWIQVTSSVGVIYSYKTLNETQSFSSGFTTYPTWTVYVQSPFASSNFTNDFRVTTIPSVLTQPSYPPNPTQSVQIILSSFNQSGGPPAPIPAAYAVYTVITPGKDGTSTAYTATFGPSNATVMMLNTPIQPQASGTKISFNITAFRYWDGLSHIDNVYSTSFNFTYSGHGGWPQPYAPLEANAQLNSSPAVFAPGVTSLPTGTPVNVSVHEALENVTFSSAEVDFTFTDHGATHLGSVPMYAQSPNTSYAILPGLPANTSLSFTINVHDVDGNAVSSGTYTYTETGAPVPTPPDGKGYFFLEVYDVATNHLVVGANYTVANLSWFANDQTNALGFGALLTNSGTLPVYLSFGTYFLTVHAFGSTVERPITISQTHSFVTITFYVASSPVALQTSAPPSLLYSAGGIVGVLAAAVTIIPIRRWFQERRAKAEAEQRRVTL